MIWSTDIIRNIPDTSLLDDGRVTAGRILTGNFYGHNITEYGGEQISCLQSVGFTDIHFSPFESNHYLLSTNLLLFVSAQLQDINQFKLEI